MKHTPNQIGGVTATNRVARGFTLLELLISLVILAIVSGAVFEQINHMQTRSSSEAMKLDMNQQAREFLDQTVRDLHMAGARVPHSGDIEIPGRIPVVPHRDEQARRPLNDLDSVRAVEREHRNNFGDHAKRDEGSDCGDERRAPSTPPVEHRARNAAMGRTRLDSRLCGARPVCHLHAARVYPQSPARLRHGRGQLPEVSEGMCAGAWRPSVLLPPAALRPGRPARPMRGARRRCRPQSAPPRCGPARR